MKKQVNNKKMLEGAVVSVKMQKTAVVSIVRQYPHPLYKKLLKRNKRINTDVDNFSVVVGDRVKITETKPISKTKHFKIMEVIKNGSA